MSEKLTIVGGGITGLATAYIAAKAGRQVTVVEAGKSFGGLLNTFEIGGNRLEFYYHHFFTHDAELRWLLRQLDLEDRLQFHDATMGVYRNGTVYPFNSPKDLLKFRPLNLVDKTRFALSSLYLGKVARWQTAEGVAAADWLRKYAGRGTTEALWQPLLDIKFGPHAHKVPLAWMIGRLRQRMNSRQKGDEKLGYLKGSLQVLLDRLLERLAEMDVELLAEAPVTALQIENGNLKAIETPAGRQQGGQFIFTMPTVYLAPLLRQQAPDLASQLDKIQYFGAVCTILEMNRPLGDTYWLNVADKGFPFGGVIEHTRFIPPSAYNNRHIAYLSRYFDWSEPIAEMGQKEIIAHMLEPLPRIYPGFNNSWLENVHVFRTRTAATVCDLNFSAKVPAARTEVENLYLASMPHIYPDERSTNNSIRVAAEVCKLAGAGGQQVPFGRSLSGQTGFGQHPAQEGARQT